jgi:DNA-binding transcriptional LysR family regulator
LLEDEFGGALFHRERRFTHLTELGRMVETYLEGVFENSRQAKQIAEQYVHLKKTPLRVGIMSTIAPDEIIELISSVRTHHPGVELHLCDADAPSLRKRLLGGDLEAAIYALPSNVPDEEVHSLPLFQEQMVMAVHLNHRLANQRSVRVTDMSNETYIHRNNCEFAGYADAILSEQGVTVSPVYWSDRDDWTLAMIAAGLGFGFMPEHTAKHPGVVPLPITDPEFWREVNLVTVRGRRHSPAVGALVREATQKKWFGERAKALSAAE